MGVDFHQRGKIMEQCLEVINRLWTEEKVDGDYPPYKLRGAVLYPKPVQKPRPPILIGGYVDAVLKRAATKGDGWLTYYYTAESFARVWAKVRGFAEEAGRDPDRAHLHQPAPHLHRSARQDRGADEAVAADRMGLRLLVGVDHGERHHGHAWRSASSSSSRTSRPASTASSSCPTATKGAGRGRGPGDHPAAQQEDDVSAAAARGLLVSGRASPSLEV